MTVINTNTASINAQYNLNKVNKEMEAAMEQLSSGKRINSAADDAAGLAISTRMESQVRGLDQAIRNASDAQALIDTTEGAHQEVTNILQRMRELAVQSANDTNVANDRKNLNAEINQLVTEINRIADQTTWNGVGVLDGSFTSKTFQIGAEANQSISVDVDSVAASEIGSHSIRTIVNQQAATTNGRGGYDMSLSGSAGSATIDTAANETAKSTAAAINLQTAATGIAATAETNVRFFGATTTGDISLKVNGETLANVNLSSVSDLRGIRDAVNAKSGTTGVTAAMGANDAEVIFTHATGEDIKIERVSGDMNFQVDGLNMDGGSTGTEQLTATITMASTASPDSLDTVTFTISAEGEDDVVLSGNATVAQTLANLTTTAVGSATNNADGRYTIASTGAGNISITRDDGKTFTITAAQSETQAAAEAADLTVKIDSGTLNGTATTAAFGAQSQTREISEGAVLSSGAKNVTVAGQVELRSSTAFTVGESGTPESSKAGYQGSYDLGLASNSSTLNKISDVSITTVRGALSAISAIDGALEKISDARSALGAVSNRLDHTISNLGSIKINIASSQSRIQDADFAKVTGDLTKSQIMSQAATAMLAQANASKQGVLSLLQG
ncbi:flagellin [Planktomarina temperata]|uniref:Flagellin n=1 Tax=Planktomarina temperata RCA23 TaxID=666509 RepID=A0AAN0RHP5_9RHOB|nr:flagellin FliC [Planktomarina temperata RCA23]